MQKLLDRCGLARTLARDFDMLPLVSDSFALVNDPEQGDPFGNAYVDISIVFDRG